MNRFERQEILKGFGAEGQLKLRQARVLVAGMGGLGCPAVLYLSAAGVGTIGIADGDQVSLSNLNRQILFGVEDIGKMKATTAASILNLKYPDIRFNIHQEYIHIHNAKSILENYDLIIDGTDNFPSRYMLNDICVLLNKPYIMASIYQNEGQLAVLNLPGHTHRPLHYRDIFPVPPPSHEIKNCHDLGVLGVLPGILGTLQAAESLKILSGFGTPLTNKFIQYNFLDSSFYEIELTPHPKADLGRPKNFEEFYRMDYVWSCSGIETMEWKEALEVCLNKKQAILVDVREPDELPSSIPLNCYHIPMSHINEEYESFVTADSIILFCQTGLRSEKAAVQLKKKFPNKHVYSIRGGIRNSDAPL